MSQDQSKMATEAAMRLEAVKAELDTYQRVCGPDAYAALVCQMVVGLAAGSSNLFCTEMDGPGGRRAAIMVAITQDEPTIQLVN